MRTSAEFPRLPVVCSAPSSLPLGGCAPLAQDGIPLAQDDIPLNRSLLILSRPPFASSRLPTEAPSNGDATRDGDDGGAPSASSSQPAGAADTDLLLDYDPSGTLWGDEAGSPAPTLADACLPFTRGALTFGSGMGVKMTVTRLQQVESWGRVEGNQGGISYALSYLSAAQSARLVGF